MADAEPEPGAVNLSAFVQLGDGVACGAYVLRIHVHTPLTLSIGRHVRRLELPAGEYLYIGSARGSQRRLPLPRRLVRHATRSAGNPPHPNRASLVAWFGIWGILPQQIVPRAAKRLFWHVDYLLDRMEAAIVQVYVIGTHASLEHAIAVTLEDDPATSPVQAGLGASDHRGHTHLLRVNAPPEWWAALPIRLRAVLAANGDVNRDHQSVAAY